MKFRFSLKLVLMELKVKKGQKNLVNSTSFCKERSKGARHSSAERPATGFRLEIPVRPQFRHFQHPGPVGVEEAAVPRSWKLHPEVEGLNIHQ